MNANRLPAAEERGELPPDAINLNRRNGKPQSCEPCRKLKSRCDHRTPVCGRCRSRCIAHECFYHPAPLTQPKPNHARAATFSAANGAAWTVPPPSRESALSSEPDLPATETTELPRVATVVDIQLNEVLLSLSRINIIGKLVRRWLQVNPRCLVPTPILEEILSCVETLASRLNQGFVKAEMLVVDLKEATTRPLVVLPGMLPTDFVKLITGRNLRLEALGIILSIAGNATLGLLESDILFALQADDMGDRQSFAQDMLSVSDTCITFCDQHSSLNDVMVWLRYENFLLVLNTCGYATHRTWSRSGQLFGDVFAMEMHREPKEAPGIPWFLMEIQSIVFACAYSDDKNLSHILGRLPRIPKHYCNRRLPLSVRNEKLLGPGPGPEELLYGLDSDGWNRQECHSSDWFRSCYILATFREEILSIQLGIAEGRDGGRIRQISARIHQAWERFPSRLRQDVSSSDVASPYLSLTRLLIYLKYLNLNFCTQQLLCEQIGNHDNSTLLKAALTLMDTTANYTRRFCRRFGASKESNSILWIYGLPSAIELANALQRYAQRHQEMSHPLPWVELYRQLSVLASDVELIADLNECNSFLYNERQKVLFKQLDLALHARRETHYPPARSTSYSSADLFGEDIDLFSGMDRDDFSGALAGGVFDWIPSQPSRSAQDLEPCSPF